ncbi:protein MpBHLH29 [Marchantia polymorpha subsp. ruderalis]|uniref:BHLH domain-containing protein n=1 Tax=Marchantia polymorpha TaxID=3197 RepID=A0A2R6XGG1_MARPO|nr:hypothetical protein MARPO_0015s0003 [Marchantia polymorpha]PTQ45178.1 hypothetical protein MARPO_0015s0003 [Marchantia polymorpha]BBN01403.1 hypothetical protein Mp_2g07150 [Marchantia polymorpha subsp. ruderalis]BBN01404.1 hypothetical protein Mp_2g07150 [Marchantia polymorpha subsp. ruderalis]|eukprot:PTQ45173.1 hypothetical protein MARPO_0015s0003 [Marchantia polymorpha]
MHSIVGRGRRPAFREEQGWKEHSSPHTPLSPNFHADPLFGTPSGSLQDILRSVHMVEGSAFVSVPKSSGSQAPPDIIAPQQQQQVSSTARNVSVDAPVIDDGLGKLQRKQLQCHTSSSWDHNMRNEHVFEGYPHVGLADISNTQLQLDSFKPVGTWTDTPGADHEQQWTDLRRSSKTTMLSPGPNLDSGTCQPSVWRERWSDSSRVHASSHQERHRAAAPAAGAAAAAAHLEESTDGGSDPMDEKNSRRFSNTAGYCSSRNLFSERKRRKKMNDGLYSLRSIVPNISKMDKASIIGDAIKYVMELERQVKELEGEMELDEQRKNKINSSSDTLGSLAATGVQHGGDAAAQNDKDVDWNKNSGGNVSKLDTKDQPNVTLELSKMKTGMYNLRMFYQQQPGIFMHMTQAIESLDLNILNSHVSTCDGYVVHSMIAKMTSWDDTVVGDVEKHILGLVRQYQ